VCGSAASRGVWPVFLDRILSRWTRCALANGVGASHVVVDIRLAKQRRDAIRLLRQGNEGDLAPEARNGVRAGTVPNPNCPSQSRRFFQVWLPFGLPRLADHPVYFGSAILFAVPFNTQMLHFGRFALPSFKEGSVKRDLIRTSWDRRSRAPTPGLSQQATSFFAYQAESSTNRRLCTS